jgi:hypothetical protein
MEIMLIMIESVVEGVVEGLIEGLVEGLVRDSSDTLIGTRILSS